MQKVSRSAIYGRLNDRLQAFASVVTSWCYPLTLPYNAARIWHVEF